MVRDRGPAEKCNARRRRYRFRKRFENGQEGWAQLSAVALADHPNSRDVFDERQAQRKLGEVGVPEPRKVVGKGGRQRRRRGVTPCNLEQLCDGPGKTTRSGA